MKGKYLGKGSSRSTKLKKALLVPSITLVLMVSQLAPEIFGACGCTSLVDLVNSLPDNISVVQAYNYETDLTKVENPVTVTRTGNGTGIYAGAGCKITSDGKYYREYTYKGDTHNYYKLMLGYEKNVKVREAMWEFLGVDTLDKKVALEKYSMYSWITKNLYGIGDLINSEEGRAKLAKIGAENTTWVKESDPMAAYITLGLFAGIINDDYGLVNWKSGETISRREFYALYYNFYETTATAGLDRAVEIRTPGNACISGWVSGYAIWGKKYAGYYLRWDDSDCYGTIRVKGNLGRYYGEYNGTDLKSPITRAEVLYKIGEESVNYEMGIKRTTFKTIRKVLSNQFTDISLKTFSKAYSDGYTGKSSKKTYLANKKIDKTMEIGLWHAYKLGVMTKSSTGKANLFKGITYDQALALIVKACQADQPLQKWN